MSKLDHDDMCEAWSRSKKKLNGTKLLYEWFIWYYLDQPNTLANERLVWLEEMDELYGEDNCY